MVKNISELKNGHKASRFLNIFYEIKKAKPLFLELYTDRRTRIVD